MANVKNNTHNVKCYLCHSAEYDIVFPSKDFNSQLKAEHIAARQGKINKDFSYNCVKCRNCGLIFSNPIPDDNFIEYLYKISDQGSYDEEFSNINQSYMKYLHRFKKHITKYNTAIDIGAGKGFFLSALLNFGFKHVIGLEPSTIACESAPKNIRPYLRNKIFREEDFKPASIDFISCLQTLEHIPEPNRVIKSFSKIISKNGIIFCIAHNVESFGVKIFKSKHPIINAGHLTLFSPKTLALIFAKHFTVIDVFKISNKYSLKYWISLMPVGDNVKFVLLKIVSCLGLTSFPITLSMGNIGIIAYKK